MKHPIDRWKYPIILAPAIALLIGMGAYRQLTAIGDSDPWHAEPPPQKNAETVAPDDSETGAASQDLKGDAEIPPIAEVPMGSEVGEQAELAVDDAGTTGAVAEEMQSDSVSQAPQTSSSGTDGSAPGLPALSAALNACLDREIARIATEARGENASVDEVMEACRKQANAFNRAFRNAYPGEDELLAIRTKTRTLAVAKRLLALREP